VEVEVMFPVLVIQHSTSATGTGGTQRLAVLAT